MKPRINVPKPIVVGVVAAELVSAVAAWRDLARRPDDQVRGRKIGWRVFIALNPGNSVGYWAFGRR